MPATRPRPLQPAATRMTQHAGALEEMMPDLSVIETLLILILLGLGVLVLLTALVLLGEQ